MIPNDLEIIGALVIQSMDDLDGLDPKLRLLFERARENLDDHLDDLQYNLWRRHGKPGFQVV